MDSGREPIERDRAHGDLDVEITTLPIDEHAGDLRQTATASPDRSPLAPRFTPRQRRAQLIATASVMIVALAVVLGSSAAARGTAIGLFIHQAAPKPTLVPGSNLFYIALQPAWGKVAIDGRVLVRLPLIGEDLPLQLANGRHTLQWRAPPLLTQSCSVSVPPSRSDTCSYNTSVSLRRGPGAWVIRFSASLTMLPAQQRRALLRAAQAALDTQVTTTTVQPGEAYSVPARGRPYSVAAGPLHATLRYLLDADPVSRGSCIIFGRDTGKGCYYAGQDCRQFCSDPPLPPKSAPPATPATPSGLAWDVLSAIYPTWNYTTLNGRAVAAGQSDDTGDASNEIDEFLEPLRISWAGSSWHVTAHISDINQLSNPICGTTQGQVQSDVLLSKQLPVNLSEQWYYVDGANHAGGCLALLALIQAHPKTVPPSTYSVTAVYFLHRFGVLLAANAQAQRLVPSLPVANAYEQQLAAQMAAQSKVLQGL